MRKAGLLVLGAAFVFLAVGLGVSQLVNDSNAADSGVPPGENAAHTSGLAGNEDGGKSVQDAELPAPVPPGDVYSRSAETLPDSAATYGGGVGGAPSVGGTATGGTGGAGNSLPLPLLASRKIIRNATLELTVEDVGAAVQRVENAATAAGGFVSGSSLSIENPQATPGPDGRQPPPRQRAAITIRVPVESYAAVMSQLRGFAKEVRAESSDTSEVTEEYTDLQARLRNLQAAEQQYLELLAVAESIPDILTVQDRLNQVRLETEQVQGRIQLLDSLTDMATIAVNLDLPPIAVDQLQPQTEPGWAEEAWDNSWQASEDLLRALGTAGITAGVVAAWLIVPGFALLILWRLFWPKSERKGAA
ncbi:MAG: DUF4349 domain-containing protein [Dehalococcoidia bacterium]|nr:DUF4349 domain-containing protein [Dehalococcoidia bacterium]